MYNAAVKLLDYLFDSAWSWIPGDIWAYVTLLLGFMAALAVKRIVFT